MIRALEDLSSLEKLSLVDMSYSRINTYSMCPAKYFYSYVVKEPQSFSAPAALGNIVHDVLEDHVGDDLSYKEMALTFERYRAVYDPQGQIGPDLIDVAYSMLSEYVDRHDGDDVEVLAKEKEFSIVIGPAFVRGFIDRIDKLDESSLHILDYKTGKFEETKVKDNLQLGIYVLACSFLYPEISTFRADLYYLRSGKRKGHLFTREDLPDLERRVIESIYQIINDTQFRTTNNVRICSFCEHASSGVCRFGTVQKNKMRRY